MTIKADIVCDTSCVFDARDQGLYQRSVLFTLESKDHISKELLMKINMTRSEEVHEAEMLEFSVCG